MSYERNFVSGQLNQTFMAYNQENKLQKIIEIQEITLLHKNKGATQQYIYETYIRPRFFISLRTYNSYLGINAKNLIKQQFTSNPGQMPLF